MDSVESCTLQFLIIAFEFRGHEFCIDLHIDSFDTSKEPYLFGCMKCIKIEGAIAVKNYFNLCFNFQFVKNIALILE